MLCLFLQRGLVETYWRGGRCVCVCFSLAWATCCTSIAVEHCFFVVRSLAGLSQGVPLPAALLWFWFAAHRWKNERKENAEGRRGGTSEDEPRRLPRGRGYDYEAIVADYAEKEERKRRMAAEEKEGQLDSAVRDPSEYSEYDDFDRDSN